MSDPGLTYRTRDEVQEVRKSRDPVEFVRKSLLEHNVCSAEEIKAMDKAIKKEVDAAVEKSRASPFPDTN
jgi:pyruvate dehydrogenase E1 component alpha subunit